MTTTDLTAIHRQIVADPFDIAARLAMADALEEAGETARAEFIRVQVELWPLGTGQITRHVECTDPQCRSRCKECRRRDLRRRERELLNELDVDALPIIDGLIRNSCGAYGWFLPHRQADMRIDATFRSGFAEVIQCQSEFWFGRECNGCWGEGEPRYAHRPCRVCHGSGRLDAHGPQIVQQTPVTEVRLTDNATVLIQGDRRWWRPREGNPSIGPVSDYICETEEELIAVMSQQIIAWARRQAGLPEIEYEKGH